MLTEKNIDMTKSKNNNAYEVSVEKLRWRLDPKKLNVATTDEVKPINDIIGQDRALRALQLGLE